VSGDDELQGEAAVIVSKPILQKVVKNLNLDVSFFAKGKIREIELYDLAPYKGRILSVNKDFGGASYYIEPLDAQSYRLTEGPGQAKHIPLWRDSHPALGTGTNFPQYGRLCPLQKFCGVP
jgi:hypothetical protein